jgi:hypothetical protein
VLLAEVTEEGPNAGTDSRGGKERRREEADDEPYASSDDGTGRAVLVGQPSGSSKKPDARPWLRRKGRTG